MPDERDPSRRDSFFDDPIEGEEEFPWSARPSAATRSGAQPYPAQPKGEGVRIIGADEAAAAIEAGQVAGRRPEDQPKFGDVPESPTGPRPSLRFPGSDPAATPKPPVVPPAPSAQPPGAPQPDPFGGSWDEVVTAPSPAPPRYTAEAPGEAPGQYAPRYVGQEYTADPGDPSVASGPVTGPTELPHWTEPPTGESPRILPDAGAAGDDDDDLKAWSSLSTGPRWRDQPTDWDEADFTDSILDDPDTRVGALRPPEPEDDEFLGAAPPPPPPPPRAATPADYASYPSPSVPRTPGGRPGSSGGFITPSRSDRDIPTAVITGAVALGIVLIAALIGPAALTFLIAIALVMAAAELYQALRTRGFHPATLLGLAGTAGLAGGVYWRGEDAYPLVIGLVMVFALLWYLTGVVHARAAANIGATVFPFLYVGFLGSFAALILGQAGKNGIGVLLGAILATAAYDIGAFFVGRWTGKTPLSPQLSPHKTVEGLVGGTFATLIVSLVIVRAIYPWNAGRAFWLAVIVAVAAPLGDLCESMIKRDLGVKDMGTLLPGHGGLLDRIDALLLVVPATYYLFRVALS
jgi:phosphatidate cytidylyltransferase